MAKNTLTVASTVDSLIGAYRSHLLGRPLPAPVSVDFTPGPREIGVQVDSGPDLGACLAKLLVWAYTLTEVTAQWWHTPSRNLHVTVTGRTAGGARMRVYTGGTFTHCHGLVRLGVDMREGVSLDELYTLTSLLREAQHEREAA
jgi:hypothetical protein